MAYGRTTDYYEDGTGPSDSGYDDGHSDGYEEGHTAGYKVGYDAGYEAGCEMFSEGGKTEARYDAEDGLPDEQD